MTNKIKDKLDAEISSALDLLAKMEIGTDDYKSTVDNISRLIDKRNDIDKIDLELAKQQHNEQMEFNKSMKQQELDEYNKKDQLIKHVISIGSIVIPVLVTVWGTYKTLKFEETGTVTTIMGRGFINKLIPKK